MEDCQDDILIEKDNDDNKRSFIIKERKYKRSFTIKELLDEEDIKRLKHIL